jgi:hypothetical protein
LISQKKLAKAQRNRRSPKSSAGTKGQADALEGLGGSIGNAITEMKGMLKQLWLLVANQSF